MLVCVEIIWGTACPLTGGKGFATSAYNHVSSAVDRYDMDIGQVSMK
jgi:hypothetical protein